MRRRGRQYPPHEVGAWLVPGSTGASGLLTPDLHRRTFIAAVDEGSFLAARRRLRRAQSVVSQTLAALEAQLGVALFDRRGRLPVLTGQGRALIGEAWTATAGVDQFKARAKSLAGGLEAELSVVMDVMLPIACLDRGGRRHSGALSRHAAAALCRGSRRGDPAHP
jgi:hypothetical protein